MAQSFSVGFPSKSGIAKPGTAALLLTPEQTAALTTAYSEYLAVADPIVKLGKQATPEQLKERARALKAYTDKMNEILTNDQKDVRGLITELNPRITRSVGSEYSQRIEQTTNPQEKAALIAEMRKAIQDRYTDELKFSLSPERFAAYQAAATP